MRCFRKPLLQASRFQNGRRPENPTGTGKRDLWGWETKTFEEYQAVATQVPLSLRNDRDRIELPVLGLQEEAGKIGSLLTKAFASGKFSLTQEQAREVKDRLSDILWFVVILCKETGIAMQDVAAHSIAQIQARAKT